MLRENNCKTIPSASTPKYLIIKEIKKYFQIFKSPGFSSENSCKIHLELNI